MEVMGLDVKWWAAGGGVMLVGVWWWRRNMGSSTEELPVSEEDYTEGDGSAQPGTTPSFYSAPGFINTNAQWAQNVLTSMTVTFADTYDPATIALAIAKYLGEKALSDVEYNIAETAIQMFGRPPTPPRDPFKETPQPGQPPPTSGTTPPAPGGLRVDGAKPHYVRISWNSVSGATQYQWAVPSRQQYGPWQTGTSALIDMGSPKPGLKISIAVRAKNAKGNSPWSGQISYTLPKK